MAEKVVNATEQFAKDDRKKKLLMFLPLVAVPFLSFAFYAVGGGKGKKVVDVVIVKNQGINTKLPIPAKASQGLMSSKLEAYEAASRDSAANKSKLENEDKAASMFGPLRDTGHSKVNASFTPQRNGPDPALAAIHSTLKNYQKTAQTSQNQQGSYMYGNKVVGPGYNQIAESEVRRQQLMDNPEYVAALDNLKKGNAMLDQIQKQTLGQNEQKNIDKKPVLQAANDTIPEEKINKASKNNNSVVSTMGRQKKNEKSNAFYGLGNNLQEEDVDEGLSIKAVIHGEQTVINGSIVKVRLSEPMVLGNNITIPANSFIYGTAQIGGERMNINFSSINYNNNIYRIQFVIYDMDGIAGISIPSSVSRTAAKAAMGNSVAAANYNVSMAQGVGQQLAMSAASSGLDAVKQLVQKKAVVVQIHLKANYEILLVQKKKENQ